MIFVKLLKKLWEISPESPLKNKTRCFCYNYFAKNDYHVSYEDNSFFHFRFKNGIAFKCYDNVFSDINISLKGYLAKHKLDEGDIVIDGGAYVGAFTLYSAKAVGNTGSVIAFEPDTLNYNRLMDNIKLNNLANIAALNKGISSKNAILDFSSEHSSGSSFVFDGKAESMVNLQVVSLDNELCERGIKKVDFIKMDIEGSEIEAVKGAEEILKRNNVNLAVASYHIVDGEKSCFKLQKLFSKLGYKAETSFPKHLTTYASKNR